MWKSEEKENEDDPGKLLVRQGEEKLLLIFQQCLDSASAASLDLGNLGEL